MREHFVLREAFHGYPLIEVRIMARGYRLSMVPFVLASVSVYRQGRHIDGRVVGVSLAPGCFFGLFEQTKLKTQKTGLHADLHFTYD